MIFKQTLHIACWNINGYKVKRYNKYNDTAFINNICNKDIICLLETHCPFEESINLPNFSAVSLIRPKNKRTNKVSGGLTVLVRSEIKQGVTFLEHTNNDYIWLKLCKKNLMLQMIFIYVICTTLQQTPHIHNPYRTIFLTLLKMT